MESSIITELFLPLALAIIMFGMGLSLTVDDFKRILIYPKAAALGLINQIILLPLVAFGLIHVFDLQPELAVGLMILAACPGGATSNLITHLAKGDAALSITLTAFSSFITVFTIPFLVNFSIAYFIPDGEEQQLNIMGTVISVLVITIIPVILGMLVSKKWTVLALKWEPLFRKMSAVFFVLILIAAILKEKDNLLGFFEEAGPVALTLNIATLAIGYFSGIIFGLGKKQSTTIAIEAGIQNGTLGITIAATLIVNSVMTIPSAIYSLIMFVTASAMILWGNRNNGD
ncbi:bile acid:sodium symporter family protein [Algoriphagus lacus]|uniref:Bile acid:sodium symporter family protein n=1 Tax=Algoriphagus lacus TaxID=2056311 RepID=A0A418PP41_9BACT|nr:bile acid:sodium symporter family protein [Algoriphagus lacus]RIW13697.1 bile acid:sodium symporter family protein [Algoriphagus lacus]